MRRVWGEGCAPALWREMGEDRFAFVVARDPVIHHDHPSAQAGDKNDGMHHTGR